MINLPLLSFLIILPLIGVMFLLFTKEEEGTKNFNVKSVSLLSSLATLVLSIVLLLKFDVKNPEFQFVEIYPWLTSLNIDCRLGVDGLSMPFVLLTSFLTLLALITSCSSITKRLKEYMIAFLLLETMMMGTFLSLDMILFYVFFEGILIPMFLIIGIWGGENRVYSTFKFFIYTFAGSVFTLIAILLIYFTTHTTAIDALFSHTLALNLQIWLWVALFFSFAIKVPMWPFHTWLPYAHVEAPTAASVILAGVLLKMGGYGFLRFSLPLLPDASQLFAPFISALSLIAVVYTSLVALVQTDIKRLIAYSSVAHMGFVTFGIFSFNLEGVQGAVFQMISHGLVSGALFFCVGVLYDRMHTRQIKDYGGVASVMPLFSVVFMIFTFASIGLPGTSGFVGEVLVLISSFKIKGFFAFILGLGIILSAAYALWLYRRVMLGKVVHESVKKLQDLTVYEKIVLYPLAVMTLLFGFYPAPILKISEASVSKILKPFNKAPLAIPHASKNQLML